MAKDKQQSNKLLKMIAAQHGVSVDEVLRDMQDAMNATWNNPDPAARRKQQELFPNGKPTLGEFIHVMAKQVKQ